MNIINPLRPGIARILLGGTVIVKIILSIIVKLQDEFFTDLAKSLLSGLSRTWLVITPNQLSIDNSIFPLLNNTKHIVTAPTQLQHELGVTT